MLNIDGVAGSAGNGTSGGGAGSTANKYKTSNASTTDRAMSGVGRGPSVFQTQGIYSYIYIFALLKMFGNLICNKLPSPICFSRPCYATYLTRSRGW